MKITKDNMAWVYAGALSAENYNFKLLNEVIMKKWSCSGLKYIKNKAWKSIKELRKMELGLP